jgi:hypothetical protein
MLFTSIVFLWSAVFGVGAWLVWQHARRQRAIAAFRELARHRQLEEACLQLHSRPLETPWCQFQTEAARLQEITPPPMWRRYGS